MKISIITVCFNSEKHIADALRSVDQQAWPCIEHLVIDGASTDSTLDVINAHPKPWRRVVSKRDSGIYDAMNEGLHLATGDFVGFLNSDDMLASDGILADIGRVAAGPTHPDAIYGDLQYVLAERPDRLVRHWRSGGYSPSRLKFGWMPPHPTFYVRRSRLKEVGEFDLGLRIAADYDFMLRCLAQPAFRVAYIPQVLVRMRTGGASNRSVQALWRKTREDLAALRKNRIGGVPTLVCKNFRKLPQFLSFF